MNVTYSRHARIRMAQRSISEEEVEAVLDDYHTSYTDLKGNPVYVGRPSGRHIKVVVRRASNPPHVITLFEQ